MEEINEKILLIIDKQFSGHASAGELEELNLWLTQGESNREAYLQLKKLLAGSQSVLQQPVDTGAAWLKVLKRAGQVQQPDTTEVGAKVSILYGWKRFTAIAAVLLLLVVATWLFTAKNNERFITVTAATANQQVPLPDGTIVNLRKAATIIYPESFIGTRKVTLTGEALFDVVHDEKSKFTIITSHTVIEDIGTTFVVTNSPARDQIVVITGKVKCADIQTGKKTVLLVAGQKAIYDSTGLSVSKVTDSNFISWETGVLDFPASVLPDVLEEVSHFYGVTVTCLPDAATDRLTLHLHFENQPLEQVLDEIKLATGLQCKKDRKKYLFYR